MPDQNCKFTRLIPKLDVKGPNVVKGIQFDAYRVLGKPEVLAEIYYREGADELIYQDTVASLYQRCYLIDVIKKTAENVFIPLTVAGGVRSVKDVGELLRAGADKVAINTAAVHNPNLLKDAAKAYGSQCIVASIEAYQLNNGKYEVWVDYGRQPTGIDVFDWVKQVIDLGVGEILLTSVNFDGTGKGFDIDLVRRVSLMSPVPVIACGGAGTAEHFASVVKEGFADAVSAASVFHYYYATVPDTLWMSFNESRLRLGAQIDSGCIEFLKGGYGNFNDLNVTPLSIGEVKQRMNAAGIQMRPELTAGLL